MLYSLTHFPTWVLHAALFSPMLFTHCTPGFIPVDAVLTKTVQICSIKVARIEHFNWPLEVYGVVAARDVVDKRRNPLFLRPRNDCQVVYEKVCILFSSVYLFLYFVD
jgi:hypothetical protein